MPEILSDGCFLGDEKIAENGTISTIFKICSYCGEVKDEVADYGDQHSRQGFCSDCAKKVFSEDEIDKERLPKLI